MLIIVDKRISAEALKKLTRWGEVISFSTQHITYEAISCHPDVFICPVNDELIVAPNCPDEYKKKLSDKGIKIICGNKPVGPHYPESVYYNAVITDNYLIHNLAYTDKIILENTHNLQQININQAYTKCNLIHLSSNNFITSDKGIEKKLLTSGFSVLYIKPEQIILPGFKHGFFGGCCGIYKNRLYINGSLQFISEGEKLLKFCNQLEVEIVELTNAALLDLGSILFVDEMRYE